VTTEGTVVSGDWGPHWRWDRSGRPVRALVCPPKRPPPWAHTSDC